MNARDELAELLAKHEDCAFSASGVLVCSCGAAMQPQEVMDDMANLAAHQADVLHAAGYRKPRTITTAEQLEALPFGSAVQTSDDSDVVVLRCEGQNFRNQSGADLSATDLWRYGTHPLTVIYEPQS